MNAFARVALTVGRAVFPTYRFLHRLNKAVLEPVLSAVLRQLIPPHGRPGTVGDPGPDRAPRPDQRLCYAPPLGRCGI